MTYHISFENADRMGRVMGFVEVKDGLFDVVVVSLEVVVSDVAPRS
jgi:hypothetical protein